MEVASEAGYDAESTITFQWDLALLNFASSCLRSSLAVAILIVLRVIMFQFQNRYRLMPFTNRFPRHHNTDESTAVVLNDVLFHLQCNFVIGLVACLVPTTTVPTALVEFGVLVISTLRQSAFSRSSVISILPVQSIRTPVDSH